MAFRQSRQILAGAPTIHPSQGNALVPVMADYVFAALPVAGDIIEMIGIGSAMTLVDATLFAEDMETGTLVTIDCGVLTGPYAQLLNANGTARTMGNEIFAASTVGQAGGLQRMTKPNTTFLVPTQDAVSIGLKIVAAPADIVVGSRLRLVCLLMPSPILV